MSLSNGPFWWLESLGNSPKTPEQIKKQKWDDLKFKIEFGVVVLALLAVLGLAGFGAFTLLLG